MGRGKLPLRLIEKERARRITCTKRKKGLMKKTYELSTLCDIRVCMIIYDPAAEEHAALITTYPEEPAVVDRIIDNYRTYKIQNPSGSKRRDLNLADFYNDRIKKLKAETEKPITDHRGHFSLWDPRLDHFNDLELLELLVHLDANIERVKSLRAERTAMVVPENNDDHQALGLCNNDHHFQDHIPSSSGNDAMVANARIGFDLQTTMSFDSQHVMNPTHYYTNLLEAPEYHSYSMDQPSPTDQMVVLHQPGYANVAVVPFGSFGNSASNNLYFPMGMEQYYHFQAPPPPPLGEREQFYGGSQQEVKFSVNNDHNSNDHHHHHHGFGRLPGF